MWSKKILATFDEFYASLDPDIGVRGKQDGKQPIQIMVGKALRTECLMKIENLKKEPLKKSWR